MAMASTISSFDEKWMKRKQTEEKFMEVEEKNGKKKKKKKTKSGDKVDK